MDRLSDSIRAVGEGDFLALIRVPRSTLKNWDTAVALGLSTTGAYSETDVVTGICFAQLVGSLALKQAGQVWSAHGAAIKQGCLLLPLEEGKETLDLIVDTHTLEASVANRPEKIAEQVHVYVPVPRAFLVFPLAELVREARRAYWSRAVDASTLKSDGRRRPARREAKQIG